MWSVLIIVFVILIIVAVYCYFKFFSDDEEDDDEYNEPHTKCSPQIIHDFVHSSFCGEDLSYDEFKKLSGGQNVNEETYINIKSLYDERKLSGQENTITVEDYKGVMGI